MERGEKREGERNKITKGGRREEGCREREERVIESEMERGTCILTLHFMTSDSESCRAIS